MIVLLVEINESCISDTFFSQARREQHEYKWKRRDTAKNTQKHALLKYPIHTKTFWKWARRVKLQIVLKERKIHTHMKICELLSTLSWELQKAPSLTQNNQKACEIHQKWDQGYWSILHKKAPQKWKPKTKQSLSFSLNINLCINVLVDSRILFS